MPVSMANIAAKTANVTLAYGGDSITVVYYPNAITGNMLAQIPTSAGNSKENLQAVNDTLVLLVKSWDLYEDLAQTIMFPLDASRLGEVPTQLLGEIFEAIMKDIRPNSQKGN